MKRAALLAAALALIAAAPIAPQPLDSQLVLDRYATKLLSVDEPKTLVFTYTVSQAGPHDIEQTHRVYRSGELVRDETLAVDGQALHPKITRIARYRNRYTIANLAPRLTQYAFLFVRTVRSGRSLQYVYRAVPLGARGAFAIDGMTVDGRTYLPSEIRFTTANGAMRGSGSIGFARSGKYWMPSTVAVQAKLGKRPARERIVFTAYQFPASLPKSTFAAPKPLPAATLPKI